MSQVRTLVASGPGWRAADIVCCAGPGDRPFAECHAAYCISLVTAGTFQYRSATGWAVLAAGGIVLGNAGEAYECGHEHHGGDRCLAFQYAPDLMDSILASVPKARRPNFEVPNLPPLRRFTSLAAAATVARDRADGPALEEAAFGIAALVLTNLADAPAIGPEPSTRDVARIGAATRRIEAESDRDLSLSALARGAEMSPYHFLRTFRRVLGVTPYGYLVRTRLGRAAARLATTRDPVTAIAFECGFNDLSTFNRYFRRMAGASPTAYRARFVATD